MSLFSDCFIFLYLLTSIFPDRICACYVECYFISIVKYFGSSQSSTCSLCCPSRSIIGQRMHITKGGVNTMGKYHFFMHILSWPNTQDSIIRGHNFQLSKVALTVVAITLSICLRINLYFSLILYLRLKDIFMKKFSVNNTLVSSVVQCYTITCYGACQESLLLQVRNGIR